ncbi:hypothetical protein [Anabaena sp. CCY 0017]|uniref:hypothetical protein n=1 Tax=Anabaena sp. CCY 0017 TaxID=3103866 RepID=UPI0039C5E9A9
MKFNKRVAIALVAISASVFGFSSVASAGEGGVAGSVAATLDTDGSVTEIAAAGAVGKNDAAATSTAQFGVVSASALGSAGVIELISDNGFFVYEDGESENFSNVTLKGSVDTALGDSQENSIATFTETSIGSVKTGF